MSIWQITNGWDVIISVSSIVSALGVFLVFLQIWALTKENRRNQFNLLVEHWGNEDERKARAHVLENFKFDSADKLENLDKESCFKVERVLARCNRISFLTLSGSISKKDVIQFVGHPMLLCWDKTQNFIKARRKRAKEPEKGGWGCYMNPFERFVTENRKEIEKIGSVKYKKG